VALLNERKSKEEKVAGQSVRAYVSDEWTLEYDLALGAKSSSGEFSAGLAEDVFIAACLAGNDREKDPKAINEVVSSAKKDFAVLRRAASQSGSCTAQEVLASTIYAKFAKDKVSKPIAAQYLAQRLLLKCKKKEITAASLRQALPGYIAAAIDYVTGRVEAPSAPKEQVDDK
jgi:putative ATP-dependent endonuclease of OLD family